MQPPPEAGVIRTSLDWLDRNGYADREIVSGVVWIDYVTGKPRSPFRPVLLDRLEKAPIGTIFAYERQFAGKDHGLSAKELRDGGYFIEVYASPPIQKHGPEPYLTLFEKVAEWAPR